MKTIKIKSIFIVIALFINVSITKSQIFTIDVEPLAFAEKSEIYKLLNIKESDCKEYTKKGKKWMSYTFKRYNSGDNKKRTGVDFGFNDYTYDISLDFKFNNENKLNYIKIWHMAGGPTSKMIKKIKKEYGIFIKDFTTRYGKSTFTENTYDKKNIAGTYKWRFENKYTTRIISTFSYSKKSEKKYHVLANRTEINFYTKTPNTKKSTTKNVNYESKYVKMTKEIANDYKKYLSENKKDSALLVAYTFLPAYNNSEKELPSFGEYNPDINDYFTDNKSNLYVVDNADINIYYKNPYGYIMDNKDSGQKKDDFYYCYTDINYSKVGSVAIVNIKDISDHKAKYSPIFSFFYGGIQVKIRNRKEYKIIMYDFTKKIFVPLCDWENIPSITKDNNYFEIGIFNSSEKVIVTINHDLVKEYKGMNIRNTRIKFDVWESTKIAVEKLVVYKYDYKIYDAANNIINDLFEQVLQKTNKTEHDWNLIYNNIYRTKFYPKKQTQLINKLLNYLKEKNVDYGSPENFFIKNGDWRTLYLLKNKLDRITDKSINKSIYFHLNSQIKQYQSLNNDKDKKLLEDYITQIYNAYRFYPYFKKIILVTPNYSWDTTLTKAKRKEIILNLIKNENLPWKNETQNFLANLLQY